MSGPTVSLEPTSRREIALERFVRRVREIAANAGEDIPASILLAQYQSIERMADEVLEGKWHDNPDPHYHEAYYDSLGNLTDVCARCGRDIRHPIHRRTDG